MTEKELIERRLAGGPGSGYKDLARISGLKEMDVWKLLKGKVPGRSKPAPQVAKGHKKSYSDSITGDDSSSRTAKIWFGRMWAGIERVDPAWASVGLTFDPSLRDSKGRLKRSVVEALDRQVAATDKLIVRRRAEHSPAGRSTADMSDQEYAASEASMVLCGLPNPSGFRSGVKAR